MGKLERLKTRPLTPHYIPVFVVDVAYVDINGRMVGEVWVKHYYYPPVYVKIEEFEKMPLNEPMPKPGPIVRLGVVRIDDEWSSRAVYRAMAYAEQVEVDEYHVEWSDG